MHLDKYPLKANYNYKKFTFFSEGPNGKIKKVVKFEKMFGNRYNLSLGDWDIRRKGTATMARTNNRDRDKVLATIAMAVVEFMDHYPDSIVFVRGDVSSKTRLYQMGINKHLKEIGEMYQIKGMYAYMWEPFRAGRNYQMLALGNYK